MIGWLDDDVRQCSTELWIGRDRYFGAEPAIDLEAARMLGMRIAASLLLRADEVIR